MKTKFSTILLSSFFFLMAWGGHVHQNGANKKKPIKATPDAEMVSENNQGGGIVGDWKLALECYDDNHNHQLDDAERKKGFSNHYFYRFSADKSCIISPFASNQLKSGFKGRYALAEKNGKKILTTYWDETEQKGQREAQYTVVSVSKDELVLLETTGDHTFWIFKRVG